MPNHSRTAGGSDFLFCDSAELDVFTPEDFSDEQKMIRDMARRFVLDEVVPEQDNIEHQKSDVTVRLLRRSAELGLVGIDIPEAYGGAGLDRVSSMIVAEQMARVASFSVTYGGQSGIGTLPILYFGSEELRQKYLPLLCRAEKISAYALSEAGSGSDALAAKTKATRSTDGSHWILNGEKMWVTNAAFADVFITFAQVDGKQFSCFLVERSFPGVSAGTEESKMGLKGSSTRPLALADSPVPIGNGIGEIGRGHEVAFNILNIGRTKLGATAAGLSKTAFQEALQYSKQRIAFGKPISSFGAIQHKIAEMAIRIWITEGIVYRTANLMDRRLHGIELDDRAQLLPALKEYAVECSIVKVFGSETLDFVVDEAVQIFGGYGFSTEYPVERYYRDARVFRIFEGTNEINRLMIAGMLLKRPVGITDRQEYSGALSAEAAIIHEAKIDFGRLAERTRSRVDAEQEILMLLADIAIEIYAMDTAFHRTRKIVEGGANREIYIAMFRTFVNDAVSRIQVSARQIAAATGSERSALHLSWQPIDTVSTRRRIAEFVLESN
jgi:alkylation response protein AidB-like acyl-CoA dehydrogenase